MISRSSTDDYNLQNIKNIFREKDLHKLYIHNKIIKNMYYS